MTSRIASSRAGIVWTDMWQPSSGRITLKPPSGCEMTVGGPDAFIPDALAAETRIPLISDWSPSCCGDAPMKSAVRCMISDGAGLDTTGTYRGRHSKGKRT